MTKLIIIFLLFLGILFIAISVTKNTQSCPPTQTVYKYIPRTFEEEQNEPVYVSDIFSDMFSQPSPWMVSIGNIDQRKQEEINKYFISQI
jgi:hypothetical protein